MIGCFIWRDWKVVRYVLIVQTLVAWHELIVKVGVIRHEQVLKVHTAIVSLVMLVHCHSSGRFWIRYVWSQLRIIHEGIRSGVEGQAPILLRNLVEEQEIQEELNDENY